MKLALIGGGRTARFLDFQGELSGFKVEYRSFPLAEDGHELVVVDEPSLSPLGCARHLSQRRVPPAAIIVCRPEQLPDFRKALEYTPGLSRSIFACGDTEEAFLPTLKTAMKWAAEAHAFREAEPALCQQTYGMKELVLQKHLLFDLLLESLPDTIYFKDRESRFRFFNPAILTKFNVSCDADIYGKTDFDIFGHEHAEQAYKDEQALVRGELDIIQKVEKETWPDGRVTWVQTTKMPIKTPTGETLGTFGISHDITHEREMDLRLQRERSLIDTLINLLPARVFVKDTELRYIFTNREHRRFLGAESAEAVQGKTLLDFIDTDRSHMLTQGESRILREGISILNLEEYDEDTHQWMLVNKVPLRDGQENIVGMIGLSVDMTEQKQLEQKLQYRNQQVESELKLARTLQQTFLPQTYPTFPPEAPEHESLLNFAHYYLPSFTLGGDFLSVQAIGPKNASVLLCDVMGHGVRAALVTAMLRAMIAELDARAAQPANFLTALNRLLHASLAGGRQLIFVTAFYGVIDADQGLITYGNAGSNCAYLLRHADAHMQKLDCAGQCGPALGLFENYEFSEFEVQMQPGDELICFTDGIVEATREGEEFGEHRFMRFLQEHRNASGKARFEALMQQVRAFAHQESFDDDICLLSAKLRPRP